MPLACAGLAAAALAAAFAGADDLTLVRVGEREIGAAEFERRAQRLAPFQWARIGASWPERRRRFAEEVLVPEALLDLEAAREVPELGSARSMALSHALQRDLQLRTLETPVSPAEIQAHVERYREHYELPASLLLWRISLRDEKEAREVIALLAKPNVADFSRLARERSLDTATAMRAGTLGFVAADGQTHMPEVRVSRLLFEAASRVRDGELVPEPVQEGSVFAVVWRRASRPASLPPADELARAVTGRVHEARLALETRSLIERLRREGLTEYHPQALEAYEPVLPSTPSGERPSTGGSARPVQPQPRASDYGLR